MTTGVNLPEIYQHLRKAYCLHFQGVRRLYLSTMSHRGQELKYQTLCTSSWRTLTTGPYPHPNRLHQRFRTSASSFIFQYLLVSLRSFSSCLCLLTRLTITYIFLSIMCFIKQFLRKIWPANLAFLRFIACAFSAWLLAVLLHFLHQTRGVENGSWERLCRIMTARYFGYNRNQMWILPLGTASFVKITYC